jgi:hypothetical protein
MKKDICDIILAIIKPPFADTPVHSERAGSLIAEFADVFPDRLSDELPPQHSLDHRTELIPGFEPVSRRREDYPRSLRFFAKSWTN